jgi:hypothetical protein
VGDGPFNVLVVPSEKLIKHLNALKIGEEGMNADSKALKKF